MLSGHVSSDLKCKIVVTMITVLLTQDRNDDLVKDVTRFLVDQLHNGGGNSQFQQTCLECLIEIATDIPEVMTVHNVNLFPDSFF